MSKKNFVVLIILVVSICFTFGLIACNNSNFSTDQGNQVAIDYGTYENIENNTENETGKNNNSAGIEQLLATLLGGLCSIIGGVLAVIITSFASKNKQKNNYFLLYYKQINNFKLHLDNCTQKNLPEIEQCIREFLNAFNNDIYLIYYIGRKYYSKEYEQFKNYLNNFFVTEFVNKFENQEKLFECLKNRINQEMTMIQKKLN